MREVYFNRFALFFCVALFASNLFAQEAAVPATYDSWLDAVNVSGAWEAGYTGTGVNVGVIDESIEMDHPYFLNFDSANSLNMGAIYNEAREFIKTRANITIPTQNINNSGPVWDNAIVYQDAAKTQVLGTLSGDAHGECVAGCIAAYDTGTNTYGAAFNSTLTGIRIDFRLQSIPLAVDTETYTGVSAADLCFASGLMYNNSTISIKNNSYGTRVGYSGLSDIYFDAFDDAKANGTVLTFSAGNERTTDTYSNCKDSNKKALQAMPSTITVAATGGAYEYAPDYDKFATFSCYGANVFVCAPGRSVRTSDRTDTAEGNYFYTDNYYYTSSSVQGYATGNCNEHFDGTSAASPIAAGVIALGVQAYESSHSGMSADTRLMKHLIAQTSTKIDTGASDIYSKWVTNSAGLSFSHTYGFGQINATELVKAAEYYDGVSTQTIATAQWDLTQDFTVSNLLNTELIAYNSYDYGDLQSTARTANYAVMTTSSEMQAALDFTNKATVMVNYNNLMQANDAIAVTNADPLIITASFDELAFQTAGINTQQLEEVCVTVALTSFSMGDLQITLTHGDTVSFLAFADNSTASAVSGDIEWTFSSNAFWGEDPLGNWTLGIYNLGTGAMGVYEAYTTFYMGELYVPEPSTWALLILGVLGLLGARFLGVRRYGSVSDLRRFSGVYPKTRAPAGTRNSFPHRTRQEKFCR